MLEIESILVLRGPSMYGINYLMIVCMLVVYVQEQNSQKYLVKAGYT